MTKCNCDMHRAMQQPVDPKVAPQGYIAVTSKHYEGSCRGCAFESESGYCGKKRNCLSRDRQDRRDVIFEVSK